MSGKYSINTAKTIAARVFSKYRREIATASAYSTVPEDWLAGLTGMENPNCREYPDSRSYRKEVHVFKKLKGVRDGWFSTYNGIKKSHLTGMSDAALENLSRSFGQTQVMGYWILTVLSGNSIGDLRDPKKHYMSACAFLLADARMKKYLSVLNFNQVCHIWNSGRAWNGKTSGIKTHSPYYMANCELVRSQYRKLINAAPALPSLGHETPASTSSETVIKKTGRDLTDAIVGSRADTSTKEQARVLIDEAHKRQDEYLEETMLKENVNLEGLDEDVDGLAINNNPEDFVKPGIQTSQGKLSILFVFVSFILSALGFAYSADQIQSYYGIIANAVEIIGPLVVSAFVLLGYTKSRTSLYSDAIKSMTPAPFTSSALLEGQDWKDPRRYLDIFSKIRKLPIPGIEGTDINTKEQFELIKELIRENSLSHKAAMTDIEESISILNDNIMTVNTKTDSNRIKLDRLLKNE